MGGYQISACDQTTSQGARSASNQTVIEVLMGNRDRVLAPPTPGWLTSPVPKTYQTGRNGPMTDEWGAYGIARTKVPSSLDPRGPHRGDRQTKASTAPSGTISFCSVSSISLCDMIWEAVGPGSRGTATRGVKQDATGANGGTARTIPTRALGAFQS